MTQNGIGNARFDGVWVVDRPVTVIMGSQWGDEGKGKVRQLNTINVIP